MPLKTRPRLEDAKLIDWIDDRANKLDALYPDKPKHLRGAEFISMVGDDLDSPKVDIANLMRAFDLGSRGTIYRWIAKLKRERNEQSNVAA